MRIGLGLALLCLGGGMALLGSPWAVPTGPGFAPTPDRLFRHTVQIALFWAALVDVGVLVLLLVTARLWTRPSFGAGPALPPPPPLRRGVVVVLIAACVVGGVLRWPAANGSFWWDEGWSITRVVRGYENPSAADPRVLELDPRGWPRTAWHWKKPTNHVLYNLAGRTSLEGWRIVGGHGPEAVDEFAFRFPAYAAAGLTILLVGLLGWRMGHPEAGAAAALLLALHPWAARYSVDGRAYAFVIPLTLLAVLALVEAHRSGRWAAWLGFAAAQLGLLWSHPFTIFLCVPLSAVTALQLALRRGRRGRRAQASEPTTRRDAETGLLRFVASNVLAGAVFLLVMAPNLAQFLVWEGHVHGAPLNVRVISELWTRLATGLSHGAAPPDTSFVPLTAFRDLAEALPALELWVFWVLPALTAFGALRLVRERNLGAVPILTLLAAIPPSMAVSHWTGQLYYPRFHAHASWAVLLCLALGVQGLARAMAPQVPAVSRGALAVLAVAFVTLASPQIDRIWSFPMAPTGEVGRYTRALAGDDPLSVIRVGYGLGAGVPRIYDPWIVPADTGADIEAQIERARTEGKPLYVFYSNPHFNHRRRPEGFVRLDDPEQFRLVAGFDGLEPRFTYRVLCWLGSDTPCPAGFSGVESRAEAP
ncbi:MAG: glycosyltransferase family 39 protein [Myxococcota bacterium]|nr:glycosyltransferase family 39 protein [Myxococcota bacterium]